MGLKKNGQSEFLQTALWRSLVSCFVCSTAIQLTTADSSIVYNMQSLPHALPPRRSDHVRQFIRKMIVAQSPLAGRRLEEVALSRQIGVSRTPLREALISLEAEGLVVSEPNKGFSVAPLDEKLVREIYPLLAALEATALERTSADLAELLPQLRSVNARLAKEARPKRQYDLDREFHPPSRERLRK